MSCCQDCSRVQERATAEMRATELHADDEWEISSNSGDTTNNLGCVDIVIPLRDWRSGNGRQGSKAENEGLGGHDERSDRVCFGWRSWRRSCEDCLLTHRICPTLYSLQCVQL